MGGADGRGIGPVVGALGQAGSGAGGGAHLYLAQLAVPLDRYVKHIGDHPQRQVGEIVHHQNRQGRVDVLAIIKNLVIRHISGFGLSGRVQGPAAEKQGAGQHTGEKTFHQ